MDASLEKRLKRHVIGKPHRFMAVMPLGFEQTLVDELKFFDIEAITTPNDIEPYRIIGDGKVEFTAKITEAWKAVAYSRIANRVLMEIANFKAENFREFEKKASEIPFELFLDERYFGNVIPEPPQLERDKLRATESTLHPQQSISIHVTCKHSRLYHSDAIAERLQKIICKDDTKKGLKARESSDLIVHSSSPQHLYVNFLDDRCTIWLDFAGEELYKRGFERFVNEAPLKETIAAAMLFEAISLTQKQERLRLQDSPSTQDESSPQGKGRSHTFPLITLIDPMSGSGTFSLEAACIAYKLIPGNSRDFALKHQPAFKESTWNYIIRRENSNGAFPEPEGPQPLFKIVTSDISERAIEIIKHNIECSPLSATAPNAIHPQLRDFFSYTAKEIADASPDNTAPIIVLNPPYGKRLDFDAPRLYTKIGKKIAELTRDFKALNKTLTVAILVPKDDCREGSKYTCTANILHECPAMSPKKNPAAKQIITSHGGLSLNVFIAVLDS